MAGTITYPYLRDKVCDLRAASYDDLTASEKKRLAAWITKAYRYALTQWPWEESWETAEYAVVDGKVTGLAAEDFSRIECWSVDPRPASSRARRVDIRAIDADGVWLTAATSTASVWIRIQPRPPVFTSESTDEDVMLWLLEEPTASLALSYWFTAEQEHEQAGRLRAEAEDALTQMSQQHMPQP